MVPRSKLKNTMIYSYIISQQNCIYMQVMKYFCLLFIWLNNGCFHIEVNLEII